MKQPLIAVEYVPEGESVTVDFFGREVLVSKADGKPRAIANTCTHLGGPLEQHGQELVCGWHGARFDVTTGQPLSGPARCPLMVLPTNVVDGVLTYVWDEQ
jgi:nitrite reductase/ring-hydroxylating ferredoxin subunit